MKERFHIDQIQLIREVAQVSESCDQKSYLVGGIVRDLLLGHTLGDYDVDFIVDSNARLVAEGFADSAGGEVVLYPKFLTAKVLKPHRFQSILEVDFASSRTESYDQAGALPTVTSSSLNQDLKRRDFTMNALAVPLSEVVQLLEKGGSVKDLRSVVIDQFGGLKDLDERKIRVLHRESFQDDPTRIFRALRYRGRLSGVIEEETLLFLREAIAQSCFSTVSVYRIYSEIRKILAESQVLEVLRPFEELDLFKALEHIFGFDTSFLLDLAPQFNPLLKQVSPSVRGNFSDALFYWKAPIEKRKPLFHALGWSSKRIREFAELLEQLHLGELNSLPSELLILGFLLGEEKATEELNSRGISCVDE